MFISQWEKPKTNHCIRITSGGTGITAAVAAAITSTRFEIKDKLRTT